jgi:MFS family permease
MYFQLFYSLPVFIEQWVDTTTLYNAIHDISPNLAQILGSTKAYIPAEKLTNIDAFYIIVFQLVVSSLVMRLKPLNAMISGIFVASIGVGLMFMTNNAIHLIFAIFIFAVGEMSSSPKITEYIGKIAPPDKVALYIGMSYLPVAGGSLIAGYLSGDVYMRFADKISIMKMEAVNLGLEIPVKINNLELILSQKTGLTQTGLNQYLWEHYKPYNIFWVFASVGVFTALALFLYDKFLNKN